MKSKWLNVMSLLLIVVLLMTACGGDDKATDTPAPQQSPDKTQDPTKAPA